jgi:predicted dehydrogenase
MTRALSVGVIGVGDFGRRHLEAYARQPGVTVAAVADHDGDRARAAAERYGVERWFADGEELIADCRPDAVSVVTPGQYHLAPALAALRNGCSVLLEKPVAMSSAEVAELTAAAAESPAFVVPAHILRFTAPYVALRSRVRAGAVGQLLGVSAVRDRTRRHERMFPGLHPAFMTAIHDIDLAMWITGARAVRVSAQGRGAVDGGPPLLVWAHVDADDGSVWSLRTTWVLPDDASVADRIEIYGTAGAAVLELEPTVTVLGDPVEAVDHELTPDTVPGGIDAEVAHFCACVRDGSASEVVTLAEAAHGIRVAEAIMASADAGGAATDVAG